jgi:phosphatidylethanolamine-binding protein (PEBP) family uncharacterized protein
MTFTVISNSFKDGDYLRNEFLSADFGFGCAGGNKSPHLQWSEAPEGTKSFAVTCSDYCRPREWKPAVAPQKAVSVIPNASRHFASQQ